MLKITATFTLPFAITATAAAGLGPFTETFDNTAENWANAAGTAFLDHFDTGGPDGAGDGFAAGTFNFSNTTADTDVVVARGQDEFGSSGNAFVGDYLAAGITELSFDVRHNLPTPATIFSRIASPANFPGAVAIEFAPVLPNQWTTISIAIDPSNPQFVTFEGASFGAVFSSVGHVQVGVRTPAAVAGLDSDFRFDIDNVAIVPTPGSVALMGVAALPFSRRSRRA